MSVRVRAPWDIFDLTRGLKGLSNHLETTSNDLECTLEDALKPPPMHMNARITDRALVPPVPSVARFVLHFAFAFLVGLATKRRREHKAHATQSILGVLGVWGFFSVKLGRGSSRASDILL